MSWLYNASRSSGLEWVTKTFPLASFFLILLLVDFLLEVKSLNFQFIMSLVMNYSKGSCPHKTKLGLYISKLKLATSAQKLQRLKDKKRVAKKFERKPVSHLYKLIQRDLVEV